MNEQQSLIQVNNNKILHLHQNCRRNKLETASQIVRNTMQYNSSSFHAGLW